MPAERVSMRQIREVLRLRFASELPQRGIAKSLGLSQGAVSGYLSRARAAGVSWPLPADLDDVQLEALLFPPPPALAADQRLVPDWALVHRELRRPNVTLALLWEEYRAGAPDGFGYSWFCDLYRGWAGRLKPKCARPTSPARSYLSTSPATPARSSMASPVRSSRYRFLSPSWAHRISPTPRRCGASSCRIGSRHMSAPSLISAASPARRSATISRPGLPRPAFTSRWSTAPMPTWRGITAPPLFRRVPTSRATRPRLKSAFRSSGVGSWHGCGIDASSRWPSSTLRSALCSMS